MKRFVETTLWTIGYDDVPCLAMGLLKIWPRWYSRESRKLISGDYWGACTLLASWSSFLVLTKICEEPDRPKITDKILIISKQLKSVLEGERYELLLRWKFISISHGIKQNEIVGRVLLSSQVISLSAITFFTYSNIFRLWRMLYYVSFS